MGFGWAKSGFPNSCAGIPTGVIDRSRPRVRREEHQHIGPVAHRPARANSSLASAGGWTAPGNEFMRLSMKGRIGDAEKLFRAYTIMNRQQCYGVSVEVRAEAQVVEGPGSRPQNKYGFAAHPYINRAQHLPT